MAKFHALFSFAIIIPLIWLSSCANTNTQSIPPKKLDSDSLRYSIDTPIIHPHHPNNTIASDVPVILQLKVLNVGMGWSDLSKIESSAQCSVMSILKGDGFKIGDTISFGQTEYSTKDSAYNIRNAKRIKIGNQYIVYLRKRKKDEITWSDSCFQHALGKMEISNNVLFEKTEEYVMQKMFIEESDSLKYSYRLK
jgi:hypothetical protein